MQTQHYAYLLLLSGLLAGRPVLAQDSPGPYQRPALVKTNLLGPFSLFLEVPTSPRQSVQLSFQRINFGILFDETRFFSLTSDYRFYLSKRPPSARRPAPKGFYVSPYLKFRTVVEEGGSGLFSTNNSTYDELAYTMFGGGATLGAQVVNRWGFTLDAFVGGGYFPFINSRIILNPRQYATPQPRPQDHQADVRLGLCLGLAFPPVKSAAKPVRATN